MNSDMICPNNEYSVSFMSKVHLCKFWRGKNLHYKMCPKMWHKCVAGK